MNIKINDLLLNVIKTSNEGLSFIDYLPKNGGAFFTYYDVRPEVSFHMRNVKFPLDIIGIDSNKRINQISQASPEEEDIILKNVLYVLETRKNLMKENKIKVGDKVVFKNTSINHEKLISSILNPLIERRDYGEKGRDFLEQQAFDLKQQGKLPIELKQELKKKKRI